MGTWSYVNAGTARLGTLKPTSAREVCFTLTANQEWGATASWGVKAGLACAPASHHCPGSRRQLTLFRELC